MATVLALHVCQRLVPRRLLAARLPFLLRPHRRSGLLGRPRRQPLERALGLRPLSPLSAPFSPFPFLVPRRMLSPRRPRLPFPSLACPSLPSGAYTAVPALCCSRRRSASPTLALLLPPHFGKDGLHASRRHIGRRGLPWAPPTVILLASSPFSSETMRMSVTADPPCLSLSARLNGSARRLTTDCCPCSSPCP